MTSLARPLRVAMIGYAFMGRAHSTAWARVGSFFDVPAFEQRVLVGRDSAGVAAAAPMTWRLRRETAGSGALGDLASHAVDQLQFLLGELVTEVSARIHTFVTERPGDDGPEAVTVDDAVWASLSFGSGARGSLEVSRVATGRKNALSIELFGSHGALRFDLEELNELWFLDATESIGTQGFRRILVTEPEHPYLAAWWPQGHLLGWEHSFVHEVRDFLHAIESGTPATPSFANGLAVQRVLAAIETSAAASGASVKIGSPHASKETI